MSEQRGKIGVGKGKSEQLILRKQWEINERVEGWQRESRSGRVT